VIVVVGDIMRVGLRIAAISVLRRFDLGSREGVYPGK